MATRTRQYLYLYESLNATISESEVGTGKTLRMRVCATQGGDPSAIGSSAVSATASGGSYSLTITRATLQTDLLANYLKKSVWVHLDDGAAWHDVYEMVVTDVDPDLLPALT